MPPADTPLPKSRVALQQVRRVLDDLAKRELSREGYSDQVPYALDRLDNVWRTIHEESEGWRTHEFGAWWKQQNTRTRESVRVLRNHALKSGITYTRVTMTAPIPGFIRVNEDKSITILDEDGSEVPQQSSDYLVAPPARVTEAHWEYTAPGLEGRSVQGVLETVYTVLADQVLPEAERLLGGSAEHPS
jgi:hypothetical protein